MPPSRWAGHLACPLPLLSLPGPRKLWGSGFRLPRRPRSSGGGSRPALSVLLEPGHVGFTEEPTGPSAPLKGALEEEAEAWRASGRGGSVSASSR